MNAKKLLPLIALAAACGSDPELPNPDGVPVLPAPDLTEVIEDDVVHEDTATPEPEAGPNLPEGVTPCSPDQSQKIEQATAQIRTVIAEANQVFNEELRPLYKDMPELGFKPVVDGSKDIDFFCLADVETMPNDKKKRKISARPIESDPAEGNARWALSDRAIQDHCQLMATVAIAAACEENMGAVNPYCTHITGSGAGNGNWPAQYQGVIGEAVEKVCREKGLTQPASSTAPATTESEEGGKRPEDKILRLSQLDDYTGSGVIYLSEKLEMIGRWDNGKVGEAMLIQNGDTDKPVKVTGSAKLLGPSEDGLHARFKGEIEIDTDPGNAGEGYLFQGTATGATEGLSEEYKGTLTDKQNEVAIKGQFGVSNMHMAKFILDSEAGGTITWTDGTTMEAECIKGEWTPEPCDGTQAKMTWTDGTVLDAVWRDEEGESFPRPTATARFRSADGGVVIKNDSFETIDADTHFMENARGGKQRIVTWHAATKTTSLAVNDAE
jgi:hypothetical protein